MLCVWRRHYCTHELSKALYLSLKPAQAGFFLPFSFIVCAIRPHSVLAGISLPDIFEVTNLYLTDFYPTLFSLTRYRPERSTLRTRLYCGNAVTHTYDDLSNEPTVS